MASNAAMANTLDAVVPQILARALMVLRARAITPALVNREYETLAGGRGSTIEIPRPAAQMVYEINPQTNQATDVQGFAPDTLSLELDQWRGSSFALTDKEELEVADGTMPGQAASAMAAIANIIDQSILGNYTEIYNAVGIAGVTPFINHVGGGTNTQANFDAVGGTRIATEASRILNDNFAPTGDRRFMVNPAAEANATGIRAFSDYSWSQNSDAIREGRITERLGYTFFQNQNMPFHKAGTQGGLTLTARRNTSGTSAVGVDTVMVALLETGTGTASDYVKGDIIKFDNHDQTYVVVAQNSTMSLTISPALTTAVPTATPITCTASHRVNLAFQRDAITFVNRPLPAPRSNAQVRSVLDPESGLALRLEVTRQRKQTHYEFDVLFGSKVLRPEHCVRVIG